MAKKNKKTSKVEVLGEVVEEQRAVEEHAEEHTEEHTPKVLTEDLDAGSEAVEWSEAEIKAGKRMFSCGRRTAIKKMNRAIGQ